jgi:hypothetical protein
MRKLAFCISTLLLAYYSFSQINTEEYYDLIDKADSLYQRKDYKEANLVYSTAFNEAGKKADILDRCHAASSWFLSGNIDSSFFQLSIIANSENLNFPIADKIIAEKNPDAFTYRQSLERHREKVLYNLL